MELVLPFLAAFIVILAVVPSTTAVAIGLGLVVVRRRRRSRGPSDDTTLLMQTPGRLGRRSMETAETSRILRVPP